MNKKVKFSPKLMVTWLQNFRISISVHLCSKNDATVKLVSQQYGSPNNPILLICSFSAHVYCSSWYFLQTMPPIIRMIKTVLIMRTLTFDGNKRKTFMGTRSGRLSRQISGTKLLLFCALNNRLTKWFVGFEYQGEAF